MAACDVIVVGSGASGVHAAWPLVEAGFRVLMLDVGFDDGLQGTWPPAQPFSEIRRLDPQQHRYFLGEDYSGLALGPLGAGPQITPTRRHVTRQPPGAPRTRARGLLAVESYALGGLAGAWGAVSFDYLDAELQASGLVPEQMRPHYEEVARRIGLSADRDDLTALRGPLAPAQPALDLDANAARVLRAYEQRRSDFNRAGVYMGRPVMAVNSQAFGERAANPYFDMDYWSNVGDSVYRPDVTLRALRRRENFEYVPGWLVRAFAETPDGEVVVQADPVNGHGGQAFRARRLILGAGALGTARIVLRSLGRYDVPVPLVCNSHTYVPCINVAGLGKPSADRRHSLAQLTLIYDPTGDRAQLVQAQMYSYRSLLLFRLLGQWPLGQREGLRAVRDVAPSLAIWVVQHADAPRAGSSCRLRREGDEDWLEIAHEPDAGLERARQQQERTLRRWMRRCGCWPLTTIRPGHGSSIHYAGQLPTTPDDRPLTTDLSGRLRGTGGVYVADGAALAYLPAKGLTLTMMANANRVGSGVARNLRRR